MSPHPGRRKVPPFQAFLNYRQPGGSQTYLPRPRFMRPFAPCFASAGDGQPVYLLTTRNRFSLGQPNTAHEFFKSGIGSDVVPRRVYSDSGHKTRTLIDRLAEPRKSLILVAKKRVTCGNPKRIVISSGRVLSNLNHRSQRRLETPTFVALPYCACLLRPAFQFKLLL